MHEVAAMQGMITTVLECMQKSGGTSVTNVQLVLGTSGHLTADAAYQHFEVLAKGTPAEHASLIIQWLPATYQCFSCLQRFESCESSVQVVCPECGDLALEIDHQDTCYVSAIDISFDESPWEHNTEAPLLVEHENEGHIFSLEHTVTAE